MAGQKGDTGAAGDAGPAGPAGNDAPAAAPGSQRTVFTMHRFTAQAGEGVLGTCNAGEQLIAFSCSTAGEITDDQATATCTAAQDPNKPAQLFISCAK